MAQKRLPADILDIFNEDERTLHDTVIEDRDTMMAHSDADANDAYPIALNLGARKLVLPKNSSPYATTLLPESMEILSTIAYKLQEETFSRRMALEPNLIDHLPLIEVADSDGA